MFSIQKTQNTKNKKTKFQKAKVSRSYGYKVIYYVLLSILTTSVPIKVRVVINIVYNTEVVKYIVHHIYITITILQSANILIVEYKTNDVRRLLFVDTP